MVVYFGREVEKALRDYLELTRKILLPCQIMKMPSSSLPSESEWGYRQWKIWSKNMQSK